MNALEVNRPSIVPQRGSHAAVAVSGVPSRKRPHLLHQIGVPLSPLALVTLGRARLAQHAASPALTYAEVLLQMADGVALAAYGGR